jgi:hypothetical protein
VAAGLLGVERAALVTDERRDAEGEDATDAVDGKAAVGERLEADGVGGMGERGEVEQ